MISIFSMSFSFICTHISISLGLAMKNLSFVFNHTLGGSDHYPQISADFGHRQGRTYGPLVSFLLATFFTKAIAKFAASSLLPIAHQPWLSNKPVNYLSFNQIHQPHQIWKPASPYLHGLTAFAAEGVHDHYSAPDPIQIDEHHPTENTLEVHHTPAPTVQDSHYNQYHTLDTTIESPDTFDQLVSQSQFNYRRQPPPQRWNYSSRRGVPPPRRDYANRFPSDSRNRYQANRYRTTTAFYDYYDNYDDLIARQPPYRTRRPPIRRKPTTENYEDLYDNSAYDDSIYDDYYEKTTKFYEKTTKPYRKRKKPTKKNKVKKRNDSEEYSESEESIEQLDDESKENEKTKTTEFKPKPRQAATTTTTEASTTTETTESTTEESSTSTTTTPSTTTAGSQNVTQPNGYGPGGNYDHISFTYGPPVIHQGYGPPYQNGYGPSNGNEAISITNNPSPFPLFYHNFPYTNLFPQDLTKNAIVQKVHDIVGFEHDFVPRE